ncbi:MAG: hypothetical protein ACE15D_18680 [Candidatus Eisenbacteria bacterium]
MREEVDVVEQTEVAVEAADADREEPHTVRVIKTHRVISTPLSDASRATLADKMTKAVLRIRGLEGEKKKYDADLNEQIKAAEAELSLLADENAKKERPETVEVELRYDYTDGKVTVVRMDTMAVVEERAMTDAEAQCPIPFDQQQEDDWKTAEEVAASLPVEPITITIINVDADGGEYERTLSVDQQQQPIGRIADEVALEMDYDEDESDPPLLQILRDPDPERWEDLDRTKTPAQLGIADGDRLNLYFASSLPKNHTTLIWRRADKPDGDAFILSYTKEDVTDQDLDLLALHAAKHFRLGTKQRAAMVVRQAGGKVDLDRSKSLVEIFGDELGSEIELEIVL